MVEERPMPISRVTAAAGARGPVAFTLTPKEVLGILQRHMLLIIGFTIVGLVVGGLSWFMLRKCFPRYTARTYVEVLPPVEKDPRKSVV